MTFSDQVRDAIRHSGQTIYRVAMSVQIQEKNLHKFMKGEVGLSLASLDRIAEYLGLNLSECDPPSTTSDGLDF